jgi:ketol-acid reductoisomerase
LAKIYHDKDADISLLKDKTIAIIGYGNQGRAQALSLRDLNKLKVIIGNIKDESWKQAKKDGFKVYPIPEAAQKADVLFLLVPDEVAPEVYKEIEPVIKEKEHIVLDFASGYNITYGFIKAYTNTDLVLVAPRMIGAGIIDLTRQNMGYPVLVGMAQDASGKAKQYALAIAKGIGSLLPGGLAIKSSFEEETLVDLLSEHGFAGALIAGIEAQYEALMEYGVSSEVAILELYASGELTEIAKVITEMGLFEQLKVHSRTSQYGQLTWGPRYVTKETKKLLREAAEEILDGRFAREWRSEQEMGMPVYNRLWKRLHEKPLVKAEDKLYKALKRRDKQR